MPEIVPKTAMTRRDSSPAATGNQNQIGIQILKQFASIEQRLEALNQAFS